MNPSQDLATDYSHRAADYSRFWAPLINPMANPLLCAMPLSGARRILDVGTGTGSLWPMIQGAAPQAMLYGVDRAEGMLREGDDLLRGRVSVMDAENLGVRRGMFDAALLLFVLFHVPDPARALREIRATLRPAGPWDWSSGARILASLGACSGRRSSTRQARPRIRATPASCYKARWTPQRSWPTS